MKNKHDHLAATYYLLLKKHDTDPSSLAPMVTESQSPMHVQQPYQQQQHQHQQHQQQSHIVAPMEHQSTTRSHHYQPPHQQQHQIRPSTTRPQTAARPDLVPRPQLHPEATGGVIFTSTRPPSSPRVHRPHPPQQQHSTPGPGIASVPLHHAPMPPQPPPSSAPRRHHRRPVVSRPVQYHPNLRPNSAAALSMSVPSPHASNAPPIAQTSLDRWLARPRGSHQPPPAEPSPTEVASQSFFSALQSRSWSNALAQQYGKITFASGQPVSFAAPQPVAPGVVQSPQLMLKVSAVPPEDRPSSGVYRARNGRRYRAAA